MKGRKKRTYRVAASRSLQPITAIRWGYSCYEGVQLLDEDEDLQKNKEFGTLFLPFPPKSLIGLSHFNCKNAIDA